MDKPAFIKNDKEVLLVNDFFLKKGFSISNYQARAKEAHCKIIEKKINEDLFLCEIINCDLYLLQQSQQSLTQALTLL